MSDGTKVLIFSTNKEDTPLADVSLMGDSTGAVAIGDLARNIEEFAPAIEQVIEKLKSSAKEKGLSEITLSLGLNAKGKVGFLGTGAEAGGDASISLKFIC